MRCLIVGSCGFIGSHLVDYFKLGKQKVFTCDVFDLPEEPNYFSIKSVEHDFEKIFARHHFDICINASGSGNIADSFADPKMDFSLNTANVVCILNAIRKFNAKCKFINFSSAAVYGNPVEIPIKESTPVNPLSPYGTHKYMSDILCKEFFDLFKIDSCSLRVFSAYGTRLKKQLLWDLHLKQISGSGTIELFGTGEETRDFIHIDDVIQVVDLVIKNNFYGGVVLNVANGKSHSISKVGNIFLKAADSNKKILFNGIQKIGDPIRWEADISRLKK